MTYREYLTDGLRDTMNEPGLAEDLALLTATVAGVIMLMAVISAIFLTFWPIAIALGLLFAGAAIVGTCFVVYTYILWLIDRRED